MTHPGDGSVTSYRVVALEGGDGVGKTTVAQSLAATHGYRVVHSAYQPDVSDIRGHYEQLMQQPGSMVLDRCFLSEVVYGQIFRGWSRLTATDVRELAMALQRQSGVLVHLVASDADIVARLHARDGSAPPLEQIAVVQARYDAVIDTLHGLVPIRRHSSGDFFT